MQPLISNHPGSLPHEVIVHLLAALNVHAGEIRLLKQGVEERRIAAVFEDGNWECLLHLRSCNVQTIEKDTTARPLRRSSEEDQDQDEEEEEGETVDE